MSEEAECPFHEELEPLKYLAAQADTTRGDIRGENDNKMWRLVRKIDVSGCFDILSSKCVRYLGTIES